VAGDQITDRISSSISLIITVSIGAPRRWRGSGKHSSSAQTGTSQVNPAISF
jgi:hypothetical protein